MNLNEADYPEEPIEDYPTTHQMVERHFPTLGYYNVPLAFTREIGESKMGVGDAIDDIVDILLDLKGVLWSLDNTSAGDALFDLNLNFQSHWGLHPRNLQLYMYVLASGVEHAPVGSADGVK